MRDCLEITVVVINIIDPLVPEAFLGRDTGLRIACLNPDMRA